MCLYKESYSAGLSMFPFTSAYLEFQSDWSVPVVSRWLWPGNRIFLRVANKVVTWWIVVFLRSVALCWSPSGPYVQVVNFTVPPYTPKLHIYFYRSPRYLSHKFDLFPYFHMKCKTHNPACYGLCLNGRSISYCAAYIFSVRQPDVHC